MFGLPLSGLESPKSISTGRHALPSGRGVPASKSFPGLAFNLLPAIGGASHSAFQFYCSSTPVDVAASAPWIDATPANGHGTPSRLLLNQCRFRTVSLFRSPGGAVGSPIGTRARRANPISTRLPSGPRLASGEKVKRSLMVGFRFTAGETSSE
jgi:hypothetical protein